jgi:hypothetical protein
MGRALSTRWKSRKSNNHVGYADIHEDNIKTNAKRITEPYEGVDFIEYAQNLKTWQIISRTQIQKRG